MTVPILSQKHNIQIEIQMNHKFENVQTSFYFLYANIIDLLF